MTVVWAVTALCCLIELVLQAADLGWVGSPQWRSLALQNGAFWQGLLHNWRPNYAAQPWLMFGSYTFLHADLWHLIGNMLVLIVLGKLVVQRVGAGGFLLIYASAAITGAIGFTLLSATAQPMVGASGALFGLIGALQMWQWQTLGRTGQSRWPVIKMMLWLVVLNLAMWTIQQGGLAWQTHLGGYIGGVLCGLALTVFVKPISSLKTGTDVENP